MGACFWLCSSYRKTAALQRAGLSERAERKPERRPRGAGPERPGVWRAAGRGGVWVVQWCPPPVPVPALPPQSHSAGTCGGALDAVPTLGYSCTARVRGRTAVVQRSYLCLLGCGLQPGPRCGLCTLQKQPPTPHRSPRSLSFLPSGARTWEQVTQSLPQAGIPQGEPTALGSTRGLGPPFPVLLHGDVRATSLRSEQDCPSQRRITVSTVPGSGYQGRGRWGAFPLIPAPRGVRHRPQPARSPRDSRHRTADSHCPGTGWLLWRSHTLTPPLATFGFPKTI